MIVESSSGTMAEGLARVGRLEGYRVLIVTDPRIDALTTAKLKALGAELEIVEDYHPTGGWQVSRLERLHEVLERHPGAFWPRQYDSPSNAGAYRRIGEELVESLGPAIAGLVGTVGSGGSLCGIATSLRQRVPQVKVVAVDAVGSVLFHQPDRQRLQSGHGNSIVPGNLDHRLIQEVHWLADGEAFNACWELAAREGIFAGGSSGAAWVVGSWVAAQCEPEQDVIVILPDRGDRYCESVYSERFLSDHGLAGMEAAAAPRVISYGGEVAQRWSVAALPTDGRSPYHDPRVKRTMELEQEMVGSRQR
jgi:cysteine synthase A